MPRATKDSWVRWESLETPDPLAPQALKGPGAAWDQRALQDGWGPKENRDWLATMDTKAPWDPSGLRDQRAKRGSRARTARPRGPPGHLETRALWVTEEIAGSQGTLDTLGIQDPGGDRDPKDRKGKRDQRESKARPGLQDGGGSRACRGCRGPGAWWGDRALKVPLEQMGFLAGMVARDSRGSKELMGLLAPWVLLGREETSVWPACPEHRDPQDSRVKVDYPGSWVPPVSGGRRAEQVFLGTRGSLDPKASRVTQARWASRG